MLNHGQQRDKWSLSVSVTQMLVRGVLYMIRVAIQIHVFSYFFTFLTNLSRVLTDLFLGRTSHTWLHTRGVSTRVELRQALRLYLATQY